MLFARKWAVVTLVTELQKNVVLHRYGPGDSVDMPRITEKDGVPRRYGPGDSETCVEELKKTPSFVDMSRVTV